MAQMLVALLTATILLTQSVWGQNRDTILNPDSEVIEDAYNLTEWQEKDAQVFFDSVFGALNSQIRTKETIQELLYAYRDAPKSPELDMADKLQMAYFHNLPDMLSGSSENTTAGLIYKFRKNIQDDLNAKLVADQLRRLNDSSHISYLQRDEQGQELWVRENVDWERVVLNTALNESNADNIKLGPLTKMVLPGSAVALRQYLDTPEGSMAAGGFAAIVEHEFQQLKKLNKETEHDRVEDMWDYMTEEQKIIYLLTNFRVPNVIIGLLILQPYETYRWQNVSERCHTDAVYMLRKFYEGERWALEMIDAAGKPPVGLFQGALNWIGQYDQCFQIEVPTDESYSNPVTQEVGPAGGFKGSYCDFKMELPEMVDRLIPRTPGTKLYLRMGVCFPSTCEAHEVGSIMSSLDVFGYQLPRISSPRCHNEAPINTGEFSQDSLAHAASGIMAGIVFLVVLATLIDGLFWFKLDGKEETTAKPGLVKSKTFELGNYNNAYEVTKLEENSDPLSNGKLNGDMNGKSNGKVNGHASSPHAEHSHHADSPPPKPKQESCSKELVQTHSIYNNLPMMMSTAQPSGALKSLDAIRFFSMGWIVLGHVYTMGAVFMPETMSNARLASEAIKNWTFQGVYTGMLSVDTFFLLSGLLVSYLFMKACAKNKENRLGKWVIQMIIYYEHRLVRILPMYAIIILVYAAFGKYLGSGPLFDWQSERVRDCNNNWWANLLFINNFVKPREMCLGWSWYLSNDMQFYFIAPIILIPLYLSAAVGYIILALFMVANWAATAYLWQKTNGRSYLQDENVFYDAYITPYTRMAPYLVGILLGHMFYKKYKLQNKFLVALWWLASILIMGVVVYVQYGDVEENGVLSPPGWNVVQRTVYETFSRTGWSISVAWIIYACNHGYAGFLAHILNWSGWAPLGRLTFTAYLIHPLVIFVYVGNRRNLNHVDNFSVAFVYCGYLTLSYVAGGILSLIFEQPAARFDKLVVGRLLKKLAGRDTKGKRSHRVD